MSKIWVSLPQISPVQDSIAFAANLESEGKKVIRLNQGAEETVPAQGALAELRKYDGSFDKGYNKAPGGEMKARENAAWFLNKFLGYGIDPENTFIVMTNGRNGLHHAFHMAAFDQISAKLEGRSDLSPCVILPELCWPMVMDAVRENYITETQSFEMVRDGTAEAVRRAVAQRVTDPLHFAALYTNFPNNPLGLIGSPEDLRETNHFLDQLNVMNRHAGLPNTVHIVDNPYFGGLSQRGKRAETVLRSPYDGMRDNGTLTPHIYNTSLAKAFALATPGAHIMSFSDADMAEKYAGSYGKSRNLLSYDPAAIAAIGGMLAPANENLIREHFEFLNTKYTRNFKAFSKHLGKDLLPADPGMVVTTKIPAECLGKSVKCSDGVTREIKSGHDYSEYLGNETGVIGVDQSITRPSGQSWSLMRWALKAEDVSLVEEGAAKIAKANKRLANAPSI